jgi:hypothetical protein
MALTLPNPDRTSFFHELDDKSYLTLTDQSGKSISIVRQKNITYSEILTYALPESSKVVEFNNLIDQILISQQQTSLIERDDSKTAEAMIFLSDILNEHWQDFPLKVKVLLLNKLKIFRKSSWKSIFISIFSAFHTIKNRINYYKGFWSELRAYDSFTQKNILRKVLENSKLLRNAWFTLEITTLRIFKSDSYLLTQNKENIDKFIHKIRIEVWENEILEAAHKTRKIILSGNFKRQTLDEFKASLLSDDEQ